MQENDQEFINGSIRNNNINNNNFINKNKNITNILNLAHFRTNIILDKLKNLKVIHSNIRCEKWGNIFALKNDNTSLDGYIWRCRSRVPQYDIKINITVFEKFRIPII